MEPVGSLWQGRKIEWDTFGCGILSRPLKEGHGDMWLLHRPAVPCGAVSRGDWEGRAWCKEQPARPGLLGLASPLSSPKGSPGGSGCKESTCNTGYLGSIPGSGRSPGGENGYPLQYSCLENSMDRGAWWATVHQVTKLHAILPQFHHLWDGGDRIERDVELETREGGLRRKAL